MGDLCPPPPVNYKGGAKAAWARVHGGGEVCPARTRPAMSVAARGWAGRLGWASAQVVLARRKGVFLFTGLGFKELPWVLG